MQDALAEMDEEAYRREHDVDLRDHEKRSLEKLLNEYRILLTKVSQDTDPILGTSGSEPLTVKAIAWNNQFAAGCRSTRHYNG